MRRWARTVAFLIAPSVLLAVLLYWWVASLQDRIDLSGGTGSHSAAILLDGRRTNCIDDEVVRTTSSVGVGNLLSPQVCESRIAVLVQDRAMHFAEPVSEWTDSRRDVLGVTLQAMPALPVSIWVPNGGQGDAKVYLAHARTIYSDMQSGIGFLEDVSIVEAGGLDSLAAGCSNLAPVTAVGKTAAHLNVYYIQTITDHIGARGIYCEDTDPNVVLISAPLGVLATLAHEIGHALTLEHVSPGGSIETDRTTGGIVEQNLMLQAGVYQKLLTTGQSFRANLNANSAINRLGARTGPVPGCHETDKTSVCPALGFDVLPK